MFLQSDHPPIHVQNQTPGRTSAQPAQPAHRRDPADSDMGIGRRPAVCPTWMFHSPNQPVVSQGWSPHSKWAPLGGLMSGSNHLGYQQFTNLAEFGQADSRIVLLHWSSFAARLLTPSHMRKSLFWWFQRETKRKITLLGPGHAHPPCTPVPSVSSEVSLPGGAVENKCLCFFGSKVG